MEDGDPLACLFKAACLGEMEWSTQAPPLVLQAALHAVAILIDQAISVSETICVKRAIRPSCMFACGKNP